MSRTKRKTPPGKWMRTPRHKWKLLAGMSKKQVVTDWDGKRVMAKNEQVDVTSKARRH